MWSCSKGATDDGWMTLACPDWRWWVGATEDSEELELVNSAKRGISWFGYETFWRNVDGSATLLSLAWLLMIQYIIIMIIKLNMHRGYLCGVFFIIDDDSLLAEWRKIIALIWSGWHIKGYYYEVVVGTKVQFQVNESFKHVNVQSNLCTVVTM